MIKLMKSMVICVLASAALSSNASALEEKMTAIYWSVAVPKDDMAKFVEETSLGGFGLHGRWFVRPRFALGLTFEWQVFDDESSDPINTSLDGFPVGVTISGKQYRYINAFPFLVTGHLHLGRAGATRIYAGGGAGAYYMMERLEIGVIALEEKNWRWGIVPEAGLLLPVGDVYGHQNLIVSAKYNVVFGDEDRFDYTWYEINLGIAWNPDF